MVSSAQAPLRIAFLGRLDSVKGPEILTRAIQCTPDLKVSLDLYGVAQESAGRDYESKLRALAGRDDRITFRAPVPPSEIVETLRNYDLLAVPSQGLETGPLVVLEAFAAGIPVLGSALGGIAELVEHGVNGLLVRADSVEAWAAALDKCVREPALLDHWRAGIRPARTMATVADEMISLYQQTAVARKTAAFAS